MVRVGLIGFGLAGQAFHAPVIRGVPGMELACILERHGAKAQEKYPEVRVARTLDEMLSDQTIKLCVVATPNDSHFSYTKACLEAGRDVVVDKPFAPTLGEAEQLVRLAADRGRLVTVYQDRRWDGDFQTVKRLLKSGAVGAVVEYEARFDRFRLESKNVWRERADHPAAGVLWGLGPHFIDQALGLFWGPGENLGGGVLPEARFEDRRFFRRTHGIFASARDLAGAEYCLRSGAAPADSRDRRIVREVWHGPAGGNFAKPELPRRACLGSGLGRGTGATLGQIEPRGWRNQQAKKDRTRGLSRFLRQRERCDGEGNSAGCDAGTGAAHHAWNLAGT